MTASRKVGLWQAVVQLAGGDTVTVAHVSAALLTAAGVDGVAVTVIAGLAAREVVHASDPVAVELEELTLTLGEGPGPDAFAAGGPVLVVDIAASRSLARWPGFAPAAARCGVRAVLAMPLQVGGIRLGVLSMYRREPGGLDGERLADALVLADTACLVILDGGVRDGVLLAAGWHPEVHQAVGMISVQLGMSVEVAFVRLRAHAYAKDRRLQDVAADVVARRLRFDPEGTDRGSDDDGHIGRLR